MENFEKSDIFRNIKFLKQKCMNSKLSKKKFYKMNLISQNIQFFDKFKLEIRVQF